jgi:predicted dehydrogenase
VRTLLFCAFRISSHKEKQVKFFRQVVLFFAAIVIASPLAWSQQPVRIGIAGLSHSHVHGFLNNTPKDDFVLVGIAESNRDMADRYAKRYGFDPGIVYDDLGEMLDKTKPDGVLAFNSIFGHLEVVEACAPRGVHVMVEKPLAVNSEHARRMAELAREYKTLVLTNYETTWYPTNHRAFEIAVSEGSLGPLRKIIVCDGHKGPKEIGCNVEFLEWLTDPVLNGGGAVIDFGCYGANLATWLMQNERPLSVSAVLQQMKPEVYPKVDDEATIVLAYPNTQVIIQASWNWPINRKDIEIYGATGYAKAPNATDLVWRLSEREREQSAKLSPEGSLTFAPFYYFATAIRGEITVRSSDLSSLENNLITVEILDAARESARTGQTVHRHEYDCDLY